MLTLFLIAASAVANNSGGGVLLSGDVDAKLLGKDDLEFARLLSRAGYTDLRDELLAAYTKVNGATPEAREVIRDALSDFALDQAWRETDLNKRWETLNQLAEEKQAFVQSKAGTPEGDEALLALTDLYRSIGELTTQLLQKETDPARITELRDKGSKLFEQAVNSIKERQEELGKQVEADEEQNPDNPNQELQMQYMFARYSLARTYYFHSLLLEKESFVKKSRLDSALEVLSDIQLDYADQLLSYEACIYEGLCRKELGELDAAIEALDAAIRLRELWEKSGALYQIDDEQAADIISLAVLQKMQTLAAKGDHAGSAATARDFFASIPNAVGALKGLAVLSQEADAYKETGDRKSLEMVARTLIEVDPNGPGGERGRELIGDAAPILGSGDKLKLAQSAESRNDIEKAIELYQEVMTEARGNAELGLAADEALGAKAGYRLGAAFWRRSWFHEAVVAWDGAADRFQKGKDAPECMWSAITGYTELQKQEQTPYYKTRARDRMSELATRYPTHAYASMASIIEGQQIEADGEFARAADAYQRIAPGSAGYEEGLYRAGTAWYKQARKLKADGKSAEFASAVARSEELLKKSMPALEQASTKTLEIAAQDRFKGLAFAARVNLGELYLLEGVNRPADVLPLFANVETEFPGDANKIAAARGLRLKALQQSGKLDEAISLLDALVREDPDAKGLEKSAQALAQALDSRGAEMLKQDPNTRNADDVLRKAARFYVLAMRGQISGNVAVRLDEIEPIANRLFALAIHFNRVPLEVKSFVDWNGQLLESELFEQAQLAYERVIPLTPSYRALITFAQTQGYLRKWTEAATAYAQLFEQQTLADLNTRTLRQDTLREKPELISAFLEWGVCELNAGTADNDPTRLSRASSIFETLVQSTAKGSKLWWQSKFFQLRALVERGEYNVAKIGMRDIERGYPNFDENQFGLKDKLTKLSDEIKNK